MRCCADWMAARPSTMGAPGTSKRAALLVERSQSGEILVRNCRNHAARHRDADDPYSEANRAPTPLELGFADPARSCLIDNFLIWDPPLKPRLITQAVRACTCAPSATSVCAAFTRTVTDAALLLDVMARYDPADPITAFGNGRIPTSYTRLLSADALKGARIGVMTNLFGTAERHAEVNQVMEGVIARMAGLGATIVRFDLPDYDTLAPVVSTSLFEARTVMDRYFAALGPNAPIKSFAELVAAKTSAVQKTLEAELAVEDGMDSQPYKDRTLNRDKLRLAVAKKVADLNLDAILYPLQKILVAPVTAEDQLERNGTLSNGTGFPAVTFPGGFSAPTASAPLGVPVGAELLGLDYTEAKLLAYAYAYAFEQASGLRKLPKSTPPLPNEP
jgi:Asp-tRNA(Asn)/Glu-tRNA(Gln) amidotransferase A subunit family amidase